MARTEYADDDYEEDNIDQLVARMEADEAGDRRRARRRATSPTPPRADNPYRAPDGTASGVVDLGERRRIRDSGLVQNRRQIASGVGEGAQGTVRLVQGRAPAGLAAAALGIVGYAIAINYLQGGFPQVKGWFAAKFANSPYTPPTQTSSTPAATPTNNTVINLAPSSSTTSATAATVVPPGLVAA